MIRASCLGAAVALLLSACVHDAAVPRARVFHAPPPTVPLPRAGFHGYRLVPSLLEKNSFQDGAPLRIGAILGGLRVRANAGALSLADTVADPPLASGVRLPNSLGGGLLFWNERALYASDSFLSTLKPLLDVGSPPKRVSFAPSFVLVVGENGQRFAIDPLRRERVPLSPPLLVDIASTPDGRALALLEGGKCASSSDSGRSYQTLKLPELAHAESVALVSESLVAQLSNGELLTLDKGVPPHLETPRPPLPGRPRADPLWPLAEPPIEQALRFGSPLGDEFAGVAVAGSVATVNLRTGELVQMTRALVPSDSMCRVLDARGGLLLACTSRTQGSIVFSDVFGERPLSQAKFPNSVDLSFADGILVAAARCDGEARPASVCVRAADGRFHDYDLSAALARLVKAAPPSAPAPSKAGGKTPEPGIVEDTSTRITRFIPKEGGGAVAVIAGEVPGLLDAESGAFAPFAAEIPSSLVGFIGGNRSWLGLDWIALREGGVRGWLPDFAVGIGRDGRLEPSVYQFRSVIGAGAHALAFDRALHAFQSADWGRTWVETLAPPGLSPTFQGSSAQNCSPVGCHLGSWLRVGWEAEVPAAGSSAQVAPAPVAAISRVLPGLACKERAAASVTPSELAESDEARDARSAAHAANGKRLPEDSNYSEGTGFTWGISHPTTDDDTSAGLRGEYVAHGLPPVHQDPPPKNWIGYSQTRDIFFVSAFDPGARQHRAAVTVRALFDAAAAAGVESLLGELNDPSDWPSLPVLGREAGQCDGLLLDSRTPVWVHDPGSAEAFSIGKRDPPVTVISAVASGPHTLSLLIAGKDGSLEVSEVTGGKLRRLFQIPGLGAALYPANPDALALGPHGALAVLRTRSGREPANENDPALLIDDAGAVQVLAPWSRLFPADAPECKPAPNDYRAVLQTSGAWLRVVASGVPVDSDAVDAGMFALVRVNPERICLEAAELADTQVKRAQGTFRMRVAARFVGPNKGASRFGFAEGFAMHQDLECNLSTAR